MNIIASMATPAAPATRPGRVILVNRGGDFEPFVTGWLGDGDSSWCWGHYFQNEAEAREDFAARCKRGF